MNKAFEKILERLDKKCKPLGIGLCPDWKYIRDIEAKKIVQEVSEEYNGGWIPCGERLPEYAEILVNCTIKRLSDGHVWVQNLIYNRIDDKWKWTDYPEDRYVDMNSFDILAWQPLPEPFKEGE